MDDERREFLKVTAVASVGALLLPACSDSSAEPLPSARTAFIVGTADVAQSLADNALENNVYWFDNNSLLGSKNQGSDHLITVVRRGDTVMWLTSGLQVETDISIAGITGPAAAITNPLAGQFALGVSMWTGKIADQAASGLYAYTVTLQVETRVMTMSKPLFLQVL